MQSLVGIIRTQSELVEAREALDALTDLPLGRLDTLPAGEGALGRAYALTGDAGHAVPLLRRAIAWCGDAPHAFHRPVTIDWMLEVMHDRLLLGTALEQTGDRQGACEQYQAVLSRWGNAKPRSVTADTARQKSKALGCK